MITCYVPTCPRCLVPAANSVEEDQDQEGRVVGDDRPGAAKLSLVLHVEPGAEQHNSRHTVQSGLHQQEHQVQDGEGVPLCPVPVLELKVHYMSKLIIDSVSWGTLEHYGLSKNCPKSVRLFPFLPD